MNRLGRRLRAIGSTDTKTDAAETPAADSGGLPAYQAEAKTTIAGSMDNEELPNSNILVGAKGRHSISADTEGPGALAASDDVSAAAATNGSSSTIQFFLQSCSSGAWLRTFNPFYDLQAGASCSVVASYVSRVLLAGNSATATKVVALKAQYLATALNIYFSSKTSPGKDRNRISAPKPIGTISNLVGQVCKGPTTSSCSAMVDARGAFGLAANASPAVMTIESMFKYVNAVQVKWSYPAFGVFRPGVFGWYNNNQAMQGLALDAFLAINSNAVYM